MKWTTKLPDPDRDEWWWLRHIVGHIPTDTPMNVIRMAQGVKRKGKWSTEFDKLPSVYYRGRWRCITEVPKGWNWRWSDAPIPTPKGNAAE